MLTSGLARSISGQVILRVQLYCFTTLKSLPFFCFFTVYNIITPKSTPSLSQLTPDEVETRTQDLGPNLLSLD